MPLRVVPLGGLGEIGMNCLALCAGSAESGPIVLVDCGVLFPSESVGVDMFHPDFSWIQQHRDRITALLITHGHEDHIGGVPYLLRSLGMPLPVYGPPYALGLIRERFREHVLPFEPRLVGTRPRVPFTIGHGNTSMEVEPIRVTHSIADATALAIRTEDGLALHTGDFKIDESPTDGETFDWERLEELGRERIRLLLSDSTGADVEGRGGSERDVASALEHLIESAPHRVVVSLFPSNIHRLRALARIARKVGRKLVFIGRSVFTHVKVAQETGYLSIPPDLVASMEEADLLPRHRVLVVATGSQAEPRAALARLALDDHPRMRLEPGDRVLLSSRAIPGNEADIIRMVSDLHRRGCDVHLKSSDPGIHASGHAHRDEQRELIERTCPDGFLPIHGTRHHLERHAAIARELGVQEVLVLENGEVGEFSPAGAQKTGTTRTGRIAVHETRVVPNSVITERKWLAEVGFVCATVCVDDAGRPVGAPRMTSRGVLDAELQADVITKMSDELVGTLRDYPWSVERPSDEEIQEVGRQALRRTVAKHLGFKPLAALTVVRDS